MFWQSAKKKKKCGTLKLNMRVKWEILKCAIP